MPRLETLRKRNLRRNLQVVKRRWPDIAELVERTRIGQHCRLEIAADDLVTLVAKGEGKELYYHSRYYPEREAQTFASEQKAEEGDLVVFLGLGIGYHVKALLPRLKLDSAIFLTESRPELLRAFLEFHDWSAILELPDVHLLAGPLSPAMLQRMAGAYIRPERYSRREWLFVAWPPALRLEPRYYADARRLLREMVEQSRVVMNTNVGISPLWRVNTWLNITHILSSAPVRLLHNAFVGQPWVVVSSGPSLEDAVEDLQAMQHCAVLCCVGSAYRYLLEHDIVPHFVVAIDSLHYNFAHFENTGSEQTYLVFDPMLYPAILERNVEPRFVCNVTTDRSNPPMELFSKVFGQVGTVPTAYSVSTACFSLGVIAGAEPLILVGQDLSFQKGRTHASGTAYSEDITVVEEGSEGKRGRLTSSVGWYNGSYTEVESNDGGFAMSYVGWIPNIRAFEQLISGSGRRTFNVSRTGAKIEGAPFRPLGELRREFSETFGIRQIIAERHQPFSSSPEKVRQLGELVEEELEGLEEIQRESKDLKEEVGSYLQRVLDGRDGDAIAAGKRMLQERIDALKEDKRIRWLMPWLHDVQDYLAKSKAKPGAGVDPLAWEVNRAGIFAEGVYKAAEEATCAMRAGLEKIWKMAEELEGAAPSPVELEPTYP